jgi:nickel transport system permease protein
MLACIAAICVFAPWLAPGDPTAIDLLAQFDPVSLAHPLGTDNFGRDIWSRIAHGGRVTIGIALAVALISVTLGVALGGVAGMLGGYSDALIGRAIDLTLAFPRLVLAIAITGLAGVGITTLVVAIVASAWAWYARMVRGMVLQAREEQFVVAARSLGCTRLRLFTRHLLPTVAGRIAVLATLDFGYLILNVSALSFLGLGVQQPTPEWGAMLNEARLFYAQEPRLMLWPGLAIFVTVSAANLLGDALRDALDPTTAPA